MTLTVEIESWPASPDRPNEDWAESNDDVVVVLDGAGIPKELPTGCGHSVAWFVQHLGPALLHHAADRNQSLTKALELAIMEVRALHDVECDLTNPNSPSATVVAFRVNGPVAEALVLADSTLVIQNATGQVEAITDNRLQQLKDRLSNDGQKPPPGAAMSAYRNQPGGFWVAGANPAAAAEAITRSWPLETLATAALLTDGAARLVDLFATASWSDLIAQLRRGGMNDILNTVRSLEESDPDRLRWRRSKTHDDATIAYTRRSHGVKDPADQHRL